MCPASWLPPLLMLAVTADRHLQPCLWFRVTVMVSLLLRCIWLKYGLLLGNRGTRPQRLHAAFPLPKHASSMCCSFFLFFFTLTDDNGEWPSLNPILLIKLKTETVAMETKNSPDTDKGHDYNFGSKDVFAIVIYLPYCLRFFFSRWRKGTP